MHQACAAAVMGQCYSAAKGLLCGGTDYVAIINDLQDAMEAQLREQAKHSDFNATELLELSHEMGNLLMEKELDRLSSLIEMWMGAETRGETKLAHTLKNDLTQMYETEGALLVSDMSGLSLLTKTKGVNASFVLIKQMQNICIPIMESCGGHLVKVSADDLFCLFETAEDAVHAACKVRNAVKIFSDAQAAKGSDTPLVINIGIDYGRMWIVPHVDVFGGAADMAFEFGEDISVEEVLVTKVVADELVKLDPARFTASNERIVEAVGEKVTVCSIVDATSGVKPAEVELMPAVVSAPVCAIEPPRFVFLLREYGQAENDAARALVDKKISKTCANRTDLCVTLVRGCACAWRGV